MRKWIAALALAFCLVTAACAAVADGYSDVYYGEADFAKFAGWYDDYTVADGLGWSTDGAPAFVVSKNASLWQEPRTNSKKLASVANGEAPEVIWNAYGEPIMQNGFYNVEYKGKVGWINSAYVAYRPLEIVLMESNVPAYCAPSTSAKRVGSLSKQTRYKVLGFYHDYYIIALRQAAAYIPMDAAHYDSAFEAAHTQRASARTTYKVTLRTGPGENYAKAGELRAGSEFLVFDCIDGWYMLLDEKTDCYVFAPGDGVAVTTPWAAPY